MRVRSEDQSKERQLRLVIAAQAGDKAAMEELIRIVSPMVVPLVVESGYNSREDQEDLLQEMRLGILEAIIDFDTERGTKFSSYAYFKVRKNVSQWYARNAGTLPMPYEAWRTAGLVDELEWEEGRTLTEDELEELTGKRYARKASTATMGTVNLEDVDGFRTPEDVSELVLELLEEIADTEDREAYQATRQFCELHDIDPFYAARMVIVSRRERE